MMTISTYTLFLIIITLIFLVSITWGQSHYFDGLLEINNEFEWVDLTEKELHQWYTPADLCILNTNDPIKMPQDIKAKVCSKESNGNRIVNCGIGMGSMGHACFGPFKSDRPSFKRGIKGFLNASATPMFQTFQKLIATNSTLVILGDSTSMQKIQHLKCQLSREKENSKLSGSINAVSPCNITLQISMPSLPTIDIYFISIGPNSKRCASMMNLETTSEEAIIAHAKHIIHELNTVHHKNLMLIANVGLWYDQPSILTQDIHLIFDWLHSLTNQTDQNIKNVVAFQETFSQHWINDEQHGYFNKATMLLQVDDWQKHPPDVYHTVPHCCQAISSNKTLDWRNTIVRDILSNDPKYRQSIVHLPYVDITRPVPDLHTCSPFYKRDCTHYCYTPLFFQPFWHQIYNLSRVL